MEIRRMPAGLFVAELEAAYRRKDGYIMGAKGQDPKKWAENSWWFTQYTSDQRKKALYWRVYAQRVWDCNGMAEGIYEDFCGVNINTKARNNYASWCGIKGTGTIPAKHRVPGAAVFIHSNSAGYITHVGYLYKPVDAKKPSGDWYVIEARGVMYGVVRTRLSARGWNRWGLMTKYFDYGTQQAAEPETVLRSGSEGAAVRRLQLDLIRLGYSCGRWGADGDFGDATELAVKAFQRDHGLTADGEAGPLTRAALDRALSESDTLPEHAKTVAISGGDCYVRTAPNTSGGKLGVAKDGTTLPFAGQTAQNGWLMVEYNGKTGWVSGKYAKLEG